MWLMSSCTLQFACYSFAFVEEYLIATLVHKLVRCLFYADYFSLFTQYTPKLWQTWLAAPMCFAACFILLLCCRIWTVSPMELHWRKIKDQRSTQSFGSPHVSFAAFCRFLVKSRESLFSEFALSMMLSSSASSMENIYSKHWFHQRYCQGRSSAYRNGSRGRGEGFTTPIMRSRKCPEYSLKCLI